MCGIFFTENCDVEESRLLSETTALKNRGPDQSREYILKTKYLKFHRLAINDLSEHGSQPFTLENIVYMCNGEIYNHRELAKEYNIVLHGHSDCEIIGHLYKIVGFHKMISLLKGYFAIVLVDTDLNIVYAGRDLLGVRAMFFGYQSENPSTLKHKIYGFSSTQASLKNFIYVEQFKAGWMWSSTEGYKQYRSIFDLYSDNLNNASADNADNTHNTYNTYNKHNEHIIYNENIEEIISKTRELFEQAIVRRFNSDVKIGCYLSGGFDSSAVCALVCKLSHLGYKISTFSIGLEGSPDLKYARLVSNMYNTNHHEVIVTKQQMLENIPHVISMIETYDVTTIRASTPMYLLSKYIKNVCPDIKVLFSGELADEISGSYKYTKLAPNLLEYHKDRFRLLNEVCYFDLLRGDKCSSGNGLEIRVPFADDDLLNYLMKIHPKLLFNQPIEKYILRKACEDLLPTEVLWRPKEAFSDGVSNIEKSWFEIIEEYVNELNDRPMYENLTCSINNPISLESKYYRYIYNSLFPNRENIIPHLWHPPLNWVNGKILISGRQIELF